MLKVGDTVKVISKTMMEGEEREFIPIGTICKVEEVIMDCGFYSYGIRPEGCIYGPFYYLESELEKGNLVWIPEKNGEEK